MCCFVVCCLLFVACCVLFIVTTNNIAAGIAICCYEVPAKVQLVARAGRVLDGVTSSLVAELIALDLGLELFTKVLEICIS